MSYLPSKEADLKAFAQNFSALITATPANYGLVAGDATAIEQAVQEFAQKWDLVQNPTTRTLPNIIAKDDAKANLLATLRGYAMQVKMNLGINNDVKATLGLSVGDSLRTPTPVPATFPILKLMSSTPRQHELRWNDSGTPDLRARPVGAQGLVLFCHVGATPPEDPMSSRFKALITRQPYRMDFGVGDVGKTAYYQARWQTATGLVGPWSQMISMVIGG